jgi:drug/metabolite transporter (DMT)-like permease
MLVLYFVWGSTYLAIAVAVDSIPPFLMAAVRFGSAGAILFLWSRFRGGPSFALPTRREWRDSFVVGALLLGGGMGMVAYSEQTVPSGIAALMIAMLPVWIAIFGRLWFGERLPRLATFGIVLGFAGILVLVGPTALGQADALEPIALGALLLSQLCWSNGSLFASHRATLPRDPLTATAAQMVSGGLVLTVLGTLTGEFGRLDVAAITSESIAALLYLTIVGSLIAFTTFGWLLRKAPLPLVTTYAFVNPVVAVILGALVLQEPITPRTVVAGAIIVVAVAVIVTARGRMQRPVEQAPAAAPVTTAALDVA